MIGRDKGGRKVQKKIKQNQNDNETGHHFHNLCHIMPPVWPIFSVPFSYIRILLFSTSSFSFTLLFTHTATRQHQFYRTYRATSIPIIFPALFLSHRHHRHMIFSPQKFIPTFHILVPQRHTNFLLLLHRDLATASTGSLALFAYSKITIIFASTFQNPKQIHPYSTATGQKLTFQF